MRGHFSIEWMAQSSLSAAPGSPVVSKTSTSTTGLRTTGLRTTGLRTAGTHSETLPGFYCRPRPRTVGPSLEASSTSTSTSTSTSNPSFPVAEVGIFKQETPRKSTNNQQGVETENGFSTEEETSGYESEGGRSLSSSSASSSPVPLAHSGSRGLHLLPPGSPQSRRPRTAFTAEQVNSLERAFKKNAYLGTQDKSELCRKLNLSDKQIRNWFQNRRMKLKRTVQDALAHACQANAVASQFLHYPDLPGYRTAAYPRYAGSSPSPEAQSSSSSLGPNHHHHHQYQLYPYSHPTATAAAAAAATAVLPMESGFYHHHHHQYPTLPAGMVLPATAAGHLIAGYPPGAYPTQHY